MFCKYCGSSIPDDAYICDSCEKVVGERPKDNQSENTQLQQQLLQQQLLQQQQFLIQQQQNQQYQQRRNLPADDSSAGAFGVLGFFLPIVGFVFYFMWKGSRPRRAKASIKGALICLGIMVFGIIAGVYS